MLPDLPPEPCHVGNFHVIVISSVRPEPTSAGQIILYRHLVDQPGLTCEIYGSEPSHATISKLIRRVAGRLARTRFSRFIEDFWILWDGRWIDPELPTTIKNPEETVVLTVAHGDGFMAARRFARRHHLPLVTFFHDWWPNIPNIHRPIRRVLEQRFRSLYSNSNIAFCVCEGMRETLGPHPAAFILPPIPAEKHPITELPRDHSQPFTVICSGNLGDYGPMLGDALEVSLDHPDILLQVRGSNPAWSKNRQAKMRANGRLLDFVPRAELETWLASSDAFLVPMVFDLPMRRRMETSFPSKLVEFAQFGKPIVVWGPAHCSAVRWAIIEGKALCVTDPNPEALLLALEQLAYSPSEQQYLSKAAQEVAESEFSHTAIQTQFREMLSRVGCLNAVS